MLSSPYIGCCLDLPSELSHQTVCALRVTRSVDRPPEAVLPPKHGWRAEPSVRRCAMQTCHFPGSQARAARRAHEELAQEHTKVRRWHDENIRRKTNYIPLLFNLLRMLAEKRQLQPLVQAAQDLESGKQRRAEQS